MTELSVIIPALNEAQALPALLDDLSQQIGVEFEVIVADGGSRDATVALANRRGAVVIETEAGRALQMNAGAQIARAPVYLFLHADSRIQDLELLARSVGAYTRRAERTHRTAGHFALDFDAHDGKEFRYRYLERKTELNRPYTTNGDQGVMVAAEFFEEIGGFDESLPFLEDQRFATQIRENGEWFTLPGRITASSRRFETEGFGRRYLLMAVIMGTFSAGVDEFFAEPPSLYAQHDETGRLNLDPYFAHIWQVTGEMGLKRGSEAWFLVGRFIKENAWQIPFAFDVLLEDDVAGTPLTDWFDDRLAPEIEGPGWDALTMVLSAGAFMVFFPAVYAVGTLRERLTDAG